MNITKEIPFVTTLLSGETIVLTLTSAEVLIQGFIGGTRVIQDSTTTSTVLGAYPSDIEFKLSLVSGIADATKSNSSYEIFSKVIPLSASRSSSVNDNGKRLGNSTASNLTLTVAANTIGLITGIQQESTGTITVAAGAGVTFIQDGLATTTAGDMIFIVPTSTLNTYIIRIGTI